MIDGLTVGLALPCLNEEAALGLMLPQLPPGIDEVVVADNASTDATAQVARQHGARVVDAPQRGYGHACREALLAITSDVAVILDADNTYPLHAVPDLVRQLAAQNLDFITVARAGMNPLRSLDALVRRLGERALALALWSSTGVLLKDSQSGMWVIRRNRLAEILPRGPGMSFSQEIKARAFRHPALAAKEIPVPFPNNDRAGVSKLRLWQDGLDNLTQALTLGRKLREEDAFKN